MKVIAAAVALAALVTAGPALAGWGSSATQVAALAGADTRPQTVTSTSGDVFVVWHSASSGDSSLRIQKYDTAGNRQWDADGYLVTNSDLGPDNATAIADGAGGVIVVWQDRRNGLYDIYAQRINAAKVRLWGADGVRVTSDTLHQVAPSVLSDGAGGVFVAWEDMQASGSDVRAQRVTSAGTLWPSEALICGAAGNQTSVRLVSDGAGGFFAVWLDGRGSTAVYAGRFDASGARVSTWAADGEKVADADAAPPVAASTGDGGVYVSWKRATSGNPSGGDVWLRRLSGMPPLSATEGVVSSTDGAAPWAMRHVESDTVLVVYGVSSSLRARRMLANSSQAPTQINSANELDNAGPVTDVALVSASGGETVVSWTSNNGLRITRLTRANVTAAGWPKLAPDAATSIQIQSSPAIGTNDDLCIAWNDDRSSATTGTDIYAQRFAPDGTVRVYYRIDTSPGPNGSISPGGPLFVFANSTTEFRVRAATGYHIDAVTVGGSGLGPIPNYTFHNVTGDSSISATFSNGAITTPVHVDTSLAAFAFPSTFSNSAVAAVFSWFGDYDISRWRLGHWDPDSNRYLEPNNGLSQVLPATGYWFRSLKDTTFVFSGTAIAETLYSMPLRRAAGTGWNQFGIPFRFPLAVSQLRLSSGPDVPITDATNNLTDHYALEWNPTKGDYDSVNVLYPNRSYWIWKQTASALSLKFPLSWDPSALNASPANENLADWSIGLVVAAGGRRASLAFGGAPVPAGRWNALSGRALPSGFGSGVSLVARVEDWGDDNGEYRSVFRPDGAALAYDFEASVAGGLTGATLRFAFDRLPAGRRVLLSEPSAGWSREVTSGAEVPLALSAVPRRFRLEVLADGPVGPPAPRATALRAVGPNPFRETAALSFTIARGGPLRWDVYDLAGRRVVSGSRAVEAGEHVVTWDGRDEAGRRVEPGLYLLRWQADGHTGTARLVRTE